MAKKEKEANNKQKGRYFKDMKAELKKVVWPSPKQLFNNTMAVIGFTLILAVIVFVLDVCFDEINKHGVLSLQQKITSSFSSNTTSENTSSEENTATEENKASEENKNEEKNENSENSENAVEAKAETNTESKE